MKTLRATGTIRALGIATLFAFYPPPALADGGVTFTDIAAGGGAGIDYGRVPSPLYDWYFDNQDTLFPFTPQIPGTFFPPAYVEIPWKARGNPGVVLFDYDDDGDLDIYVSNGPGAENSLFSNQLIETGTTTFLDVAVSAGVTATYQDSSGVAAGDIDNDGDQDLLVLGAGEPNILYENNGDGTFTDVTGWSGVGGGYLYHVGASMGDVDGDGLLDIVVANSFVWDTRDALLVVPFELNQHNQLYLNQGNNQFTDVSAASGIRVHGGFAPGDEGKAGITWAIAMVDYDLDGDTDIMTGDDQAAITKAAAGGTDTGLIHFFENDGTGYFVDRVAESGIREPNSWMGFSYGDFNGDGFLDFFCTNFGEYTLSLFGPQPEQSSKWFLGQGGGTFTSPGIGTLAADPFGWGTSAFDYDNDGDRDVLYHGSDLVSPLLDLTNPGVLLQNDGQASFSYDDAAFAGSTNHLFRNVQGVATGDLNNDGFVDVVTTSNFNIPPSTPGLVPNPGMYGGPFDGLGFYILNWLPTANPGEFLLNPSFLDYPNGTLSVEINSADNGNAGVEVRTVGGVGLTPEGKVNRDGIGAVVSFAPHGGRSDMVPVVAGSSYASQDSLAANFGLGTHAWGTVEVLWPGGVRNRLRPVQAGTVVFPEIPVSYDDPSLSLPRYVRKVKAALSDYVIAGVISNHDQGSFLASAIEAYLEAH